MKFNLWVVCLTMVAVHASAAPEGAADRGILERSLKAQEAWRTLSGNYRSMFTNFALDDNTPAADRVGRFTVMRTVEAGAIDRLFGREFDVLKGEPGDSTTYCGNAAYYQYTQPDGSGERSKAEDIQYSSAAFLLNRLMLRTLQMRDSAMTRQLPDTVIDGRSCHLFALYTADSSDKGTSVGWYRLAIDRESLLPIWQARRDRAIGGFNMDQSDTMELFRLQIDGPVSEGIFDAQALRVEEQVVQQGSCRVGERAYMWNDLMDATTGRLYALDSLLGAGNVVVMDWSTSTCGSCLMAMPTIDSLYHEYRERGAQVAFVMMDHGDSRKQALSLIERKGIEFPVLLCPKSVADAYGLHAYPVFLVVGRDGKIVFHQGGFGGGNALYLQLKEVIDRALLTK